MNQQELKQEYNRLLQRAEKADKYLNSCTEEEFDRWYPNFLKICEDMDKILKQIESYSEV